MQQDVRPAPGPPLPCSSTWQAAQAHPHGRLGRVRRCGTQPAPAPLGVQALLKPAVGLVQWGRPRREGAWWRACSRSGCSQLRRRPRRASASHPVHPAAGCSPAQRLQDDMRHRPAELRHWQCWVPWARAAPPNSPHSTGACCERPHRRRPQHRSLHRSSLARLRSSARPSAL
jgi:hypothetical protein